VNEYTIWWSPVGQPNGSTIIKAVDRSEALGLAYIELLKRSGCGAYGADLITAL
jgi:hypothetical protein